MGLRNVIVVSLVASVCAVAGCGPHAYLKDYFQKNGGFAYMNLPGKPGRAGHHCAVPGQRPPDGGPQEFGLPGRGRLSR